MSSSARVVWHETWDERKHPHPSYLHPINLPTMAPHEGHSMEVSRLGRNGTTEVADSLLLHGKQEELPVERSDHKGTIRPIVRTF